MDECSVYFIFLMLHLKWLNILIAELFEPGNLTTERVTHPPDLSAEPCGLVVPLRRGTDEGLPESRGMGNRAIHPVTALIVHNLTHSTRYCLLFENL